MPSCLKLFVIDGEDVTNRENISVWSADFNSEDPDLMIGMFVQHQVLSK